MSVHASALAMAYARQPSVPAFEKVVVLMASDLATCDDSRMVMWLGATGYETICDSLANEIPGFSWDDVRGALYRFAMFSGYTTNTGDPADFAEMQLRHDRPKLRAALTPVEQMRDTRGHVYLMRCGARYKIGITNDLDRRLAQLGKQSPYPIEVVHSIRAPYPKSIETRLHAMFDRVRVHGEWFEFNDDDIPTVIEAMNDAVVVRV